MLGNGTTQAGTTGAGAGVLGGGTTQPGMTGTGRIAVAEIGMTMTGILMAGAIGAHLTGLGPLTLRIKEILLILLPGLVGLTVATGCSPFRGGTRTPISRWREELIRYCDLWDGSCNPNSEHLTEEMLASPSYLENIIDILNNKAGIRQDDEKRRAFKSAVTENGRRKDETLAQYAMRRLRDFNHASTFGVVIPDEFRATMLKEGAGLSEQNMQNLSSMVQGREHCPEVVARALARLDVRSDRMTGYVDDGVYVTIRDSKDVEVHAEETSRDALSSDEESQSLDEESLYKELEALD